MALSPMAALGGLGGGGPLGSGLAEYNSSSSFLWEKTWISGVGGGVPGISFRLVVEPSHTRESIGEPVCYGKNNNRHTLKTVNINVIHRKGHKI